MIKFVPISELKPLDLRVSGIYLLYSRETWKVYVGQSKYVGKRIASHLNDLRANRHKNYELQSDFNAYGEGSLEFALYRICDMTELAAAEQRALRLYRHRLYNVFIPVKDKKKSKMTKNTTPYLSEHLASIERLKRESKLK